MAKYISTKTYRHLGPVAYRQWRADSHCNLIHGYALSFHFEFETDDLDARNWVVDFGGLRPLKDSLEDWFDQLARVVVLGAGGLEKYLRTRRSVQPTF